MPAPTPKEDASPAREGQRRGPAVARRAATGSRPTFFAPLQALLTRRLRFQRRGFHIHILLEPPAGPQEAAPAEPSSGAALRHDHRQLAELLRKQADLRHTLRHLACAEQMLVRQGARGLQSMPEKVLTKALEQLDGLGRDDSSFVLPELSRRLRHALVSAKERASHFMATQAMDISEASHSLFDEMERSWNGHMPASK